MFLITILRGFRVPFAVLDSYLLSHGLDPTEGIPSRLYQPSHVNCLAEPPLDPPSAFFRARLSVSNPNTDSDPDADPAFLKTVRLFIPHRRGFGDSAYGYVAYAFVMVLGQRHVDLALEMLEQAPPDLLS